MLNIEKLSDNDLKRLIDNRWKDSATLWSTIEKEFKKNKKYWQNDELLTHNIPAKRSKTTDNRLFLAMESVLSNLTARPSSPLVVPGNETKESGAVATDLQDLFLEKYRILGVKKKIRKSLRWLLLSRMMCLKVIWNNDIDDFDVKVVDSRKVRFSKRANTPDESEFAIEEITIGVSELLARFPDQEEDIMKQIGGKKEDAIINNQEVTYFEAWLNYGEWTAYKFREKILKKEPNPYWDWNGVYFDKDEMRKFENIKKLKDKKRILNQVRQAREARSKETQKYQNYLFNHFDRPKHPFIFSTMLEIEDGPVGQTSLVQQVRLLQSNINQRKRQIADNAAQAQGRWKADTKGLEGVSKGQLQAMKADPAGIIFGDGVRDWLTIEAGRDLPSLVKDDLILSIEEVDNIFGTMPTFRGEQGTKETATGRAILREQSYQRLDEPINLVDDVHLQLYNWWLQLIKCRYTETHYTKILGKNKAIKVIEMMQDSLEDGIEVKVIPGQILPKDRVFRTERAFEGVKNGFMIPLQYFQEAEFDNPMETAKQVEMYKISPFSVLDMDEQDLQNLMKGINLLKELQGSAQPTDERAQTIANMRMRIQQTVESEEFQNLPEEKQRLVFNQLKNQLNNLIKVGQTASTK